MEAQKRNMKKLAIIGVAGAAAVFTMGAGTAIGLNALTVQVPFLPAVGQTTAQACDSDGVNTVFTYGNSSNKGVKVTSVTVSGIDANCALAKVEFVESDAIVETYSSSVASGSATMSTNIFTNAFNDVRVVLTP